MYTFTCLTGMKLQFRRILGKVVRFVKIRNQTLNNQHNKSKSNETY